MIQKVYFRPSSDFKEKANRLFLKQKERIARVAPSTDIQHIGGTAIPGLLTKGDLDINVRVEQSSFSSAIEELKKMYAVNQSENWTQAFASFKDDNSFPMPLGVQLTVIGSPGDHFVKHRDLLLGSPALVEEFNEVKSAFEAEGVDEYRAAKAAFLEKMVR